jgi:hypothetical protein
MLKNFYQIMELLNYFFYVFLFGGFGLWVH